MDPLCVEERWADISVSPGRDGKYRKFNHPFIQSLAMFIGEFSCLLAFRAAYHYFERKNVPLDERPSFVTGNRDFNPFIFITPAVCDLVATTTMYIGLNLTYASSFQMLRGALIVFTGLLSVAFLNRKLRGYEWLGIAFVIAGLVIVGIADMLSSSDTSVGVNRMITGDLLIIMAQVIAATQMVVEERFVSTRNVSPLEAVGYEGFFGACIMSLLLIPFYYIRVGNDIFDNPGGVIEDSIDAFVQIGNNWQVAVGVIGTIVSISFFNFSGISVTKEMSATTRTVLDSIRTFVIWAFSLAIGWQTFSWLQLLGFLVLMVGMLLYNNVVIRPLVLRVLNGRRHADSIIAQEETQNSIA